MSPQELASRAARSPITSTADVLVCESDRGVASLLADVISTHCAGVRARVTLPGDHAELAHAAKNAVAAVCRCGESGSTRFSTLGRITEARPGLPTLLLVPAELPALADDALKIGATDVLLNSPGYLEQLPLAVRKLVRSARIREDHATRESALLTALESLRKDNLALAASADRLETLAATDSLTGLANRRTIDARLAEHLSAANRYDLPLTVLAVDVDGLKSVNDALGHAAGDDILELVADVLHGACRRSDVVGRMGGDEFVVILPHTEAARAMTVAKRAMREFARRAEPVRERLTGCPEDHRGVVRVVGRLAANTPKTGPQIPGLSIGLAMRPAGTTTDAEQLLAAADEALYRAKSGGRGRTAVCEPSVRIVVRGTKAAA